MIHEIIEQSNSEEQLKKWIQYQMDHNFEKFIWLLYRLDIDEKEWKLQSAEREIDWLCDQIIKRLKDRKSLLEQKNRGDSPNWSFDLSENS